MKNLFRCLLILATAMVMGRCNNGSNDNVKESNQINGQKADSSGLGLDKADSEFITEVADAGMTEVELGKLAQTKASNQGVKDYGAMMVRDHTRAGNELKTLAASKNVTLPLYVSNEHQKMIMEMSKMSGNEFDNHYIGMMVNDHKKVVDDFSSQAGSGKDEDLRTFASKTLPVLQIHLDSAKALQKKLVSR